MRVELLAERGLPGSVVEVLKRRGIEELNPVQVEAVRKGLLDGGNLLVVSPTASGKTLVAEIALVKAFLEGGIGVYLTPLKALASEKYEEFRAWESLGARVGISTGDYESPGEQLGRCDILVVTYERFDSLLRLKPRWLGRVRVVAIDELHMVNDPERGPVLEVIVARLKARGVRLVGLSATVGNPRDLARWLDASLVDTSWRPVRLVEGVYDRKSRSVFFSDGRVERVSGGLSSSLLNVVLQSVRDGHQVLAFVHNRKRVEAYAAEVADSVSRLLGEGELRELAERARRLRRESPSRLEAEKLGALVAKGVAYHHAGLSPAARRVVEEAFRDRLLRAVFATPTLAAGVNLPARRVVVSVRRYDPASRRSRSIPVFEYKQMAGRAGRPRYDRLGEAIIIDAPSRSEGFTRYVLGEPEPAESKLASERALRTHALALVAGGEASTLAELVRVFENTLFHVQFPRAGYLRSRLEAVVGDLVRWGMLEDGSGGLRATEVGRAVAHTYLDPLTGHEFLTGARGLRSHEQLALLHLISGTPDYVRRRPHVPAKVAYAYEDEALSCAERGLVPEPPEGEPEYLRWLEAFVHARMLGDWIDEASEDVLCERYGVDPGDVYAARDAASWIASGLARVAAAAGMHGAASRLERLAARIKHGVREDALELVRLEGVGRVRARTLIRAGIGSLEELARAPSSRLLRLPGFGPGLVRAIKEQLRRMGYDTAP